MYLFSVRTREFPNENEKCSYRNFNINSWAERRVNRPRSRLFLLLLFLPRHQPFENPRSIALVENLSWVWIVGVEDGRNRRDFVVDGVFRFCGICTTNTVDTSIADYTDRNHTHGNRWRSRRLFVTFDTVLPKRQIRCSLFFAINPNFLIPLPRYLKNLFFNAIFYCHNLFFTKVSVYQAVVFCL